MIHGMQETKISNWSLWIKRRNRNSRAINKWSLFIYTKIKTWHIKVNIFKKFQHSRGHRDQALRTSFRIVLEMSFLKPASMRDVKSVFSQMPKALHKSGDDKHIIKEAFTVQESIHSAFNTWCKCMKGEVANHDWIGLTKKERKKKK